MKADRRAPRRRIGLILGFGQLSGRGALAIYLTALIRLLTRSEYGGLAFAVTAASVLIVAADGGVSRIITRDASRQLITDKTRLTSLMRLRGYFVGAAVAVGISLSLLSVIPFGLAFGAWLAGYVGLEGVATGFEWAAIGAERPYPIAGGQLASGAVLVLWLLVIVWQGATPALAVAGLAFGSAAKLVVHMLAWRAGRRQVGAMASREDRHRLVTREALPYFIFGLLAILYYRIDLLILHSLRSAVDTAEYAAAYRVIDAVSVLGLVAYNVLAPHFSRLHATERHRVWPEWKRYLQRIALPCTLGGAALMLLSGPLCPAVFGAGYLPAISILRILVPGAVFMVLGSLNGSALLMGDVPRHLVALAVGGLGLNCVLTVVGALVLGGRGVAMATTLSEAASFAAAALLIRWRFGGTADRSNSIATRGHQA